VNAIKQAAVGFSLAILVVTLMIGWRVCVKLSGPAHMQAIAAEFASVGKFFSATPIMPNKACNKLLFCQGTEQGVGIFFLDIASGQKRLIYEQPRKFYDAGKFKILGWAPDDSLFAYKEHDPVEWANSRIDICNGNSGEVIQRVNVDGGMWNNFYVAGVVSDFVWLSSHAFAYMRTIADKRDLIVVEEKNGNWVPLEPHNITGKPTGMLTATSTHSVVWQEENTLQSLDFISGSTTQIFESTTNGLEGFSFSPDAGNFLLLCEDETGETLFKFRPAEEVFGKTFDGLDTNLCRISSQSNSVEKALWINNEKGVAYLVQDLGQMTLFIKTNVSADPMPLLARGSVIDFAVSGNQIFVAGSFTNELPGIWQYNLASGSLNCVYSSQEHPFKYAKYIVPLCKSVTNASGREITYQLWEPVRSSNAKRSPLLIGRSLYSWEVYPEVAANGGDFFVNVDRPSYRVANIGPWDEDVMTVYGELVKDSRIDTNAVFLYGSSAETGGSGFTGLVSLVAEKPNLWKGAILFSPTDFPDLSDLHLSKILTDEGMDDAGIESVIKYQQAAAEAGVPVTLALHKDAGHVYWANSARREQAQQLARFLFGY
jgi:hypothetical protein